MHGILQQLAHIPGVVGALVAGPRGELFASAFPPLFDELALHQVAGLFSDDTAGLRRLAGPDGSLDVRYARGRAMAKPFTGGTVLVIATVTVDAQLLGLSLEQAARRLDGASRPAPGAVMGGTAESPAQAAAGPPPLARTVTAGLPVAPPEVMALRAPLLELLVSHIGPVGEIVFSEAWAAWTGSASPSREGLARLVEDLAREIDDAPERARFVAAARARIG